MPEDTDLSELGIGALHERNEHLKGQIEGLNTAARAEGGTGANKFDEDAQEFSRKQIRVESEIQDRLMDIHMERDDHARAVDESKSAERADTPEQWMNNPQKYDWPGIDTPR